MASFNVLIQRLFTFKYRQLYQLPYCNSTCRIKWDSMNIAFLNSRWILMDLLVIKLITHLKFDLIFGLAAFLKKVVLLGQYHTEMSETFCIWDSLHIILLAISRKCYIYTHLVSDKVVARAVVISHSRPFTVQNPWFAYTSHPFSVQLSFGELLKPLDWLLRFA